MFGVDDERGGEESIMGCVQVGVKGGMKPHSFLVDIAKIVFCFFFWLKQTFP